MNLAKIDEVIKASPAIQIQSKISLLQRRAWNVLLANAYKERCDAFFFEEHRGSSEKRSQMLIGVLPVSSLLPSFKDMCQS